MRHPAADRGAPVDWTSVRRILVARTDNLGDVVMLTPALRALRAAAPWADLDLLAAPAGAAVAPMLPVRKVHTHSPSWQRLDGDSGLAAAELELAAALAAEDYDAMLVFTSARQSPWPTAYLGMLAGIGVRAVHSEEFGGSVATHWITPPDSATHQVDRALHLLAALGVPPRGRALELRLSQRVEAEAALGRRRGPRVLVAPGASCSSKRYDRFGEAAGILARAGVAVVVAGAPKEAGLVAEVVERADHPAVRALPAVSVPTLAAVIAEVDAVVCNNSGPMHLADAVGTPVVVAWAGTEAITDMPPRDVPHELLTRPVACAPCRQFRCPYEKECLDVSPAEVADATLRLACPAERKSG